MGCLPHGFYEDQLKGYLSQFGDVTRLRISRNKKVLKLSWWWASFDGESDWQIKTLRFCRVRLGIRCANCRRDDG
jgi:nucleolar protein 15